MTCRRPGATLGDRPAGYLVDVFVVDMAVADMAVADMVVADMSAASADAVAAPFVEEAGTAHTDHTHAADEDFAKQHSYQSPTSHHPDQRPFSYLHSWPQSVQTNTVRQSP